MQLKHLVMIGIVLVSPAFLQVSEAPASDITRWGITTRKKLEDKHGQMENRGPAAVPSEQAAPPAAVAVKDPPARPAASNQVVPEVAPGVPPAEEALFIPIAIPKPPHVQIKRVAVDQLLKKEPAAAEPVPLEDGWSGEAQKTACEAYVKALQDAFLKTRHASIQGASCDTALHADAFMRLVERCRQECPPGMLEKKGYTGRIIRNVSFLQILGNDRCITPGEEQVPHSARPIK